MKEVAIISKNKTLSRFIELEAISCGASPRIFSSMPKDVEVFSLVFLDIDTVEAEDIVGNSKVYTLSAEHNGREERALCSPPSLVSLRRAVMNSADVHIIYSEGDRLMPDKTLTIDEEHYAVVIDSERFTVSDYEMRVLKLLCERFGKAVSREEINARLGAEDGNIADVYVCRLRKKLEKNGERRVIKTVRGAGYMILYADDNVNKPSM